MKVIPQVMSAAIMSVTKSLSMFLVVMLFLMSIPIFRNMVCNGHRRLQGKAGRAYLGDSRLAYLEVFTAAGIIYFFAVRTDIASIGAVEALPGC